MPAAKPAAASWNGKSSTFGSPRSRTYVARSVASFEETSPNIWKSGTPAARAAARILGAQTPKNAALTCFAVSIRKPSSLYRAIQSA